MKVTVYDIAEKVGLPVHTVVRALNGTTKCKRSDARERVELIRKAAEELNYSPNDAARSLATRKSHNVGFILSSDVDGGITNTYFARLLSSVEQVCRLRKIGVHFGVSRLDEISRCVFPKAVEGRNIDAVFLAGGIITRKVIEEFTRLNIPGLCFSHCEIKYPEEAQFYTVARERIDVMVTVVEYLVQKGHQRIGVVEIDSRTSRKIKKHVSSIPRFAGLEYISLYRKNTNEQCVLENMVDTFVKMAPGKRPTAIIVFARLALPLINSLMECGLKCPEDVSVFSIGYEKYFQYTQPQITAIDVNEEEMGAMSAELMCDFLEGKSQLSDIMVKPTLKIMPGTTA